MTNINVGETAIGSSCPVWVVAELSGNHHRDYGTAVALIHAAKEAGADAVKTQCFTPGSMTIDSDALPFRLVWDGRERTLHDLYAETAMPLVWHAPLKALAESLGLTYFASVFDQAGTDLLTGLGVSCFKIASFEITDTLLIRYVASKGKPLLISTGMATAEEIQSAVRAADSGIKDRICLTENKFLSSPCAVVLLKCTSAYPAPVEAANLSTIPALTGLSAYRDLVGLSDHTQNNAVTAAAVALGACVVERHLKLSPDDPGPDAGFSDTPEQFAAMVQAIRETETALGKKTYGPTESEQPMLRFRRSLWVVKDVAAGEAFTLDNLRSLRPVVGLLPKELYYVLSKTAARDCKAGEPLTWEMVLL